MGTSGCGPGVTLSLGYLQALDVGGFLSRLGHSNPRVVESSEPQLPHLRKGVIGVAKWFVVEIKRRLWRMMCSQHIGRTWSTETTDAVTTSNKPNCGFQPWSSSGVGEA